MNKLLKTLIAGVSALTMCISAMSLSASAATTSYKKGDVNGDGIVNSSDVLALNNFLHGSVASKNGTMAERLDVNKDGVIDKNDLDIIKSINLGLTNTMMMFSDNTIDLPIREDRKYCIFNTKGVQISSYWIYKNDISEISANSSNISNYSLIDGESRVPENGLKGVVRLTYLTGSGTGFVVDNHTILTAAHCLYNEDSHKGETILKIHFYDDYNVEDTSVTATPISYQIPYGYVRNYDSDTTNNLGSSSNYDYALITVEEDLSQYINFNIGVVRESIASKNPEIYVTGFGGYGDKIDENNVDPNLIHTKSTGHDKLWNSPFGNYFINYKSDQIPGDSGGPVYIYINGSKTVIGIATYSSSTHKYNIGNRITTDILQFIYHHK